MHSMTERPATRADDPDVARQAPQRSFRHAKGFTLTELLVLVAIGAVLSGLLAADLSQSRSKLAQEACANNLRQWGVVFQAYAHDYDGAIMIFYGGQTNYNRGWYSTAGVYGKYWSTNRVVDADSRARMIKAKLCPSVESTATPTDDTMPGYSMIRPEPGTSGFRGFNLKDAKKPNQLLVMIDSVPTNIAAYVGANGAGLDVVAAATNRHSGGANLLFCDGHVDWKSWPEIQTNFTTWTSLAPP